MYNISPRIDRERYVRYERSYNFLFHYCSCGVSSDEQLNSYIQKRQNERSQSNVSGR